MGTIFIDIDGTLTEADRAHAKPILYRVERVKALMRAGNEIVLWSARGRAYAESFAKANGMEGIACVSKPSLLVDDNPTVRPLGSISMVSPQAFFG